MKKRLAGLALAILLVVTAFVCGRWVERARSGYHYEVLEEKEIKSASGPIYWKSVAESVGFPFLDPEMTLIEVDGRIIYKAKRAFQETYPAARNVRVHEDLIEWEDGEYAFSLKMQKVQPDTAPAGKMPPK